MHYPEHAEAFFGKDLPWEALLDKEAGDWLVSMRADLFEELYEEGYRVELSLFPDTRPLLRGGSKAEWQKREQEVASEEIALLKQEDERLGRVREYRFRSPSIGPHSDWRTKAVLKPEDIKIQSAGLTIFVKDITSPA